MSPKQRPTALSAPTTNFLLSDDDLAGSADVLASLGGSLVLSSLQTDDGLASLQLLLGEVALGLISGLGAQPRSLELGVLVGLAAEGEQGVGHLSNVLLLVQVDGLEDIDVVHSVILERLLEVVDVLHHLELASGLVDLRHGVRHQLVDQAAQHGSVLEHILVQLALGELHSHDGLDPGLGLLILDGIALASELRTDTGYLMLFSYFIH